MSRISWLREPDRLKSGDVAVCVLSSLLIFLFAPENLFSSFHLDGEVASIVSVAMFLSGMWSARRSRVGLRKADAFYIRSWWAFLSGLICVPACFFFRRVALDASIIMMLFGGGGVAGSFFYRSFASWRGRSPG